jgi:hypothetical protein
VVFQCDNNFKDFYFCHCKQCQQLTGSAFASNIITNTDNIKWLKGEELVSTFIHPSRDFAKAFCKNCGCGLPYINKTKTALVIPAGSLNELPNIKVSAKIFTDEKALWHENTDKIVSYCNYPQ